MTAKIDTNLDLVRRGSPVDWFNMLIIRFVLSLFLFLFFFCLLSGGSRLNCRLFISQQILLGSVRPARAEHTPRVDMDLALPVRVDLFRFEDATPLASIVSRSV